MAHSTVDFSTKYADFFDKIVTVRAEGIIPVTKYRSKRTGLTIFHSDIPGPLVHGNFYLATEAQDDDGLPHTLEHLIFLGSEIYPYKGVLDIVANRCLATGTNAWTDVDHTCYTMTTAGSEGFLQLLPIYLDHILYPVLSESGFITEVHHINEDGEDAGVVYCEMQGRENVADCLLHLNGIRAMYPEPSGYRYETGGIMKNLRESTDNIKVKNYHSTFYRPENLGLAIAGQIDCCELLDTIMKFEERILSKSNKPNFVKPWQAPIPSLVDTIEKTIPFPCDEETNGMVAVAWRGPLCKEIEKIEALTQLGDYLCDTAIAPLHKEFVEQNEPFCSRVSNCVLHNSETCILFTFMDVPVAKLHLIKEKLLSALNTIAKGKEPFDLKRMHTLLHNKAIIYLNGMESWPESIITAQLILDFLYLNDNEDLDKSLNHVSTLRDLMKKSTDYWLDLIKEFIIDKKFVLVAAEPSVEHMRAMSENEERRIYEQRERLGEEGLKKKGEELMKATKHNEIPPPDEMINSVPVPDVRKIQLIPVKQSCNHKGTDNSIFALNNLPVCFVLDDCKSNFVQISAILNSHNLPYKLRLYLPIYCEVLFESPILRENVLIPHEEIIAQLLEDVFKTSIHIGFASSIYDNGSLPISSDYVEAVKVNLLLEMKRYTKGVHWLRELLFSTQFTPDRLKIVVNKMLNSISSLKRQGTTIIECVMKDMCYDNDSNNFVCSVIRQQTFLSLILLKLDSNPDEVINDLNTVRSLLINPENITVYMAADVKQLSNVSDLEAPWLKFLPKAKNGSPDHMKCSLHIKSDYELIKPIDKCTLTKAIVGIGAIESSFLTECVPSINNWNHEDLPALMVLLQYLSQLEGPMWRQIRGLGLAYSFSLLIYPEEGMLYLMLYECTHVTSAYREAKRVLESHISGEEAWKEPLLDSARSSLAYEIIGHEGTIPSACHQSLLSYYRKVESNHTKKLLENIWKVTINDLKRVGPLYVSKLISSDESRLAICCHPSKVEEVVLGFKDMNQNLEVIPSLEEGILCSLEKQ